ncbi:hypothetical protein [Haloarchaeobius amylolyticus]|uniref:hypothetical protein n=1 Tax=Haloarchaeobius amylolyticus TaxID=1198296 RepID=UPI002271076F|nr:hypothetical protein [Haloarchaeobius amylolyticus]
MKRRALLTSLAGGIGALAGCLDESGVGGPGGTDTTTRDTTRRTTTEPTTDDPATTDDRTTTDDDETTTEGSDRFEWDPASEEPFAESAIGDRDSVAFPDNNRPAHVRVWNMADEARDLRLTVADGLTDELDGPGSVTFPADEWYELTLQVPTLYTVTLLDGDETLQTLEFDHGDFDCNSGAHMVGVEADGTTHVTAFSTAVGCPAPEITATSLGAGEGDCASRDTSTATVSFTDDGVDIEGTLVTGDPCYEVSVGDIGYNPKTDELRVTLTTQPGDGSCMNCVGAVPFQASAGLKHDLPAHVVVRHQSNGETTTVAEAMRNADA